MHASVVWEEIGRVFEAMGGEFYYGEPVTQLQHALQAAHWATQAGADDDMVAAALLHDIGHMLDPEHADEIGVVNHDAVAMDWMLSRGFSERTAQLAAAHVAAKRYLVATNPEYDARLSAASRETLRLQGGPMSAEEAEAFRADPMLNDKLRLRTWDEAAKDPTVAVPDLAFYKPIVERALSRI